MLLPYESVFSRYRGIIDDPSELSLEMGDLIEICTERLHTVVSDPRMRAKFSTLVMYDEIQQLEFELKNSVDDFSDKEFVLKILSLGMAIQWYRPKVDSLNYTMMMIGGKEEKSLQNNYKAMQSRMDVLESELAAQLSYHGYINNSYIRGNS